MSSTRFRELDGLRGIAALAVVLLHFTVVFEQIFPGHEPLGVSFPYGGLGVQLFFLISGYVILMTSRRYGHPGEFLRARAIRLYPTYWVSLTLTVLVVFGLGVDRLFRPFWEIASNYTMFQSFVGIRDFDGVYWSLAREMVFYLLIALTLWVCRRKVPDWFVHWFALAWALGGLALIAAYAATDSSLVRVLVLASVAQYAPLFGLGMNFYLYATTGKMHPVVFPLGALVIINEALMTNWVNGLLCGGLVLLFAWVIVVKDVSVLRNPVLVWLGGVSYPLYLLHQNIGYSIMDQTIDTIGAWPARILALAVVLLLAWAVHELVEVRLSRALNRRLSRGRKAAVAVDKAEA